MALIIKSRTLACVSSKVWQSCLFFFKIAILISHLVHLFWLYRSEFTPTHVFFGAFLEIRQAFKRNFKWSKQRAGFEGCCCPLGWAQVHQSRIFLRSRHQDVAVRGVGIQIWFRRDVS